MDAFVLVREDNREIVGITTPYDNAEHALVTVQGQGVYLYNIYDQKCLKSWLVGPSSKFDLPALFVGSNHLMSLQERKYLVRWGESDTKLQHMKKETFEEGEIHSIIGDKFLPQHVLAVFKNGSIGMISVNNMELSTVLHHQQQDSMHTVSSGSMPSNRNDIPIFVLCEVPSTSQQSSGKYILFLYRWIYSALDGPVLKRLGQHTVPNTRPGQFISTCSMDPYHLTFVILWNDSLLQFLKFPTRDHLAIPNSIHISTQHQLKHYSASSPSFQPSSKSAKKAAKQNIISSHSIFPSPYNVTATTLKHGYVMLAGPVQNSAANFLVTIWDTRFGLIHTHKILDVVDISTTQTSIAAVSTPKETTPVLLKQMVSTIDGNATLLNFGSVILAWALSLPPSSLAEVLGQATVTKQFCLLPHASEYATSAQFNFVNAASLPLKPIGGQASFVTVTQDSFNEATQPRNHLELNAITTLCDKSKTPDYSSFMEAFNAFLQDFSLKSLSNGASENAPLTSLSADTAVVSNRKWKNLEEYCLRQRMKVKKEARHGRPLHGQLSHQFVEQVSKRCLEEDFLWHPLRKLIESKAVSSSSVPALLPTLKRHNKIELIAAGLTSISDISEVEIVGIVKWLVSSVDTASLQLFIDEYKTKPAKMVSDQSSAESQYHQTPMDTFFNAIVSTRVNEPFLKSAMQLLNLRETIAVLRYCLSWFESSYTIPPSSDPFYYFNVPSAGNVLLWLGCLIDARMTELVLIPECGRYLKRIHTALVDHLDTGYKLQLLHACLANYYDHDPTPRDVESDYSIELLRLEI